MMVMMMTLPPLNLKARERAGRRLPVEVAPPEEAAGTTLKLLESSKNSFSLSSVDE